MADEVDLRRVEQIMLRTALGLDPGVMSPAERLVAKRFIQEAVENWQHAGALPRAQDPLDLTPTDVLNRYRQWASLEALRLDPAVGWQPGQSLMDLLKVCGDRQPHVKAALRLAGIELPQEWEPPDDD